jgi:hypothetical protein
VKTLIEHDPDWSPGDSDRLGLPRPLYDGHPVPYASTEHQGEPEFSLDGVRETRDWQCGLCGLELADPVFYFTSPGTSYPEVRPEYWEIGEIIPVGLHARCSRLGLAHCPGLSAADGPYSVSLAEWRESAFGLRW